MTTFINLDNNLIGAVKKIETGGAEDEKIIVNDDFSSCHYNRYSIY